MRQHRRLRFAPMIAGAGLSGLLTAGSALAFPYAPGVSLPGTGYVHDAQVTGPSVGGSPAPAPAPGEGAGGVSNESRSATTTNPIAEDDDPASTEVTDDIVTQLSETSVICQALPATYRIDCLAKQLEDLSDRLPDTGDYGEAKATLEQAADDLAALSRSNRDPSQPRLKVTVPSQDVSTTTRPLAAITPTSLPSANAQAIEILESATTVLLRSPDTQSERAVSYQRIATALDSQKVLLRS